MGEIGIHQGHAYGATVKAVNEAKSRNYTLTITGHSLGAYLAELSVYYCHADIGYRNVKGVTFDGPGSREMMK